MRSRLRALSCILVLVACESSFERAPRVTPVSESLWALVGLQIQIDSLRPYLAENPGRSFPASRLDRLESEVLAATESLTAQRRSDDELRSARYRVDLISVGLGLIQVDAFASSLKIGGSVHSNAERGLRWVEEALDHIHADPRWPAANTEIADRIMSAAVGHRDNARASVPVTKTFELGVQAASFTSGVISLVRLTGAGLSALARLVRFAQDAGDAPVLLGTGVGALQVVSGGRILVLTTEEALALAKAGQISPAALNVFLAASSLHHICTDKNLVSDRSGGPWTPRFEEFFKKAGMTLQDPENLVRVEAHQGPHPEEYHQQVREALQRETGGIKPFTDQYREALKRALAKLANQIQAPGSRLNQLVAGATTR
jgi:HNH/ENDO VII superfamily nuclease